MITPERLAELEAELAQDAPYPDGSLCLCPRCSERRELIAHIREQEAKLARLHSESIRLMGALTRADEAIERVARVTGVRVMWRTHLSELQSEDE